MMIIVTMLPSIKHTGHESLQAVRRIWGKILKKSPSVFKTSLSCALTSSTQHFTQCRSDGFALGKD